tara:strand:+ start:63 stop:617 length:555 start_codon:yes stop_codon:yes gene_type:complete
MKNTLFEIPFYSISISDWKKKKSQLKEVLKNFPVSKFPDQDFLTNRKPSPSSLIHRHSALIPQFLDIFKDSFEEFLKEVQGSMKIKDMWSVIYNKNDNQIVHNHGSTGYSGLLYIEFNSKFHSPTTYVQPWNHIDLDVSVFNRVQVKEGTMIIVPSFINHFVPANTSNTPREIIAFDMRRQEEA